MARVTPNIASLFPAKQRGLWYRHQYLGTGNPPLSTPGADLIIFADNSTWKYLDDGSNQGTDWRGTSYDDSLWSSGAGQLGYGDGDEATTVGFGGNSSAKYPTTYFRKTINIYNGGNYANYEIALTYDDGYAVFVNGSLVDTTSLAINAAYDDFATSSSEAIITSTISTSAFKHGANVIAVEMHQSSATSSDMSFDMSLKGIADIPPYEHVYGDYMVFQSASAVANVTDGPTSLNEISGMIALSGHTANIGTFAMIDDSVAGTVFFVDRDGASQGTVALEGITWTDAETMLSYTDQTTGKRYMLIGEIGDNGASTVTKNFIRFEEPLVSGSAFTLAASAVEEIAWQYPASPTFSASPGAGTNRGDAEGAFVCPIDEKIYVFSKRETKPRIYSLPLQGSYTGTQTLTYVGEVDGIENMTTGPSSPNPNTNITDATISNDHSVVLLKTYDKVYQFYRTDNTIPWSTVLTVSASIEDTNYVGYGTGPAKEPQGEAMTFDANDTGYYTTSEYSGSPGSLPIYYYPLSSV